jgi:multiple sugar transport system ATP-binding protein
MAKMELRQVGKVYADGTRAVKDLSLRIEDGEFLVFVGPSGCGKTTALRMIAGLETISEGEIQIGDRVVNHVPPRDRDIAMVFQSYALYPHLTVRDNIGFGLQLRKMPKAELERRVAEAARILGLTEQLDRRPGNLSGGQRQRVAMGRAIVRQPQAFLMDEPLSNLDAKLRVQMRAEIGKLQRDLNVTTVYVTHDQTEAMTLGHRVAVMKAGVLQQVAPPQLLYDHPENLFVAGFIGSPAMNFLPATLHGSDTGHALTVGSQRIELPDKVLAERPALAAYIDRHIVVGVRPEDIDDATLLRPEEGCTLTGEVELIEPLGSDLLVHAVVDAPQVRETEGIAELSRDAGDEALPTDRTRVIARFNPRSTVQIGDRALMAVDTERLHFFDGASGTAIWTEPTSHSHKEDETW